VSNLVKGNEVVKVFLTAGRKAGAPLGFRRKEGIGGEVEKARPALAEGSGNLRNAELTNGKWPGVGFIEPDGGIDIVRELLKCVSGTRFGHWQAETFAGTSAIGMRKKVGHLTARLTKAIQQGLLKLVIGVNVDRIAIAGNRREGILTEIETGYGRGFFGAPMPRAKVAFFALIQLLASRSQTELARPVKRQVVAGKCRRIAEVRVPALTSADEKNAIPGVPNDVPVIAKGDFEFITGLECARQEHTQKIIPGLGPFLRGGRLIGKRE
jgi:hypothetical protein